MQHGRLAPTNGRTKALRFDTNPNVILAVRAGYRHDPPKDRAVLLTKRPYALTDTRIYSTVQPARLRLSRRSWRLAGLLVLGDVP